MKNNSLRNLTVGFGFSLLLLLLAAGVSYFTINRFVTGTVQASSTNLISDQNQLLSITTTVLVILPVLILVIAFILIRNNFRKRDLLQLKLEHETETMNQRLALISDIAEQISAGDYNIRIPEDENGGMGELAEALNQMAIELQKNFNKFEAQTTLQEGVVKLNNQLIGEKSLKKLTQDVLEEVIKYANANVGVIYLPDEQGELLRPIAGYACKPDNQPAVALGEGLLGQVAIDKEPIILQNTADDLLKVKSGLVDTAPVSIVIYPLLYNNHLQGIIEIGTMQEVSDITMNYLNTVSATTAIAINTAQNRLRLHELLQETQAQSEELQVQQDELQRSNVELELQSKKLQESEEELRVQQEELLQSNQELEEKAQLLEEQNQYIAQKRNELLQLNADVELKNKELEQASKYKSEFLANMSHELRTPLNSILLLAKLLAESKELDLGDDRYEYARVIHSSGMGLLELINEILDLSKIEAGQMQLLIEEVPFEEIKNDLLQMFAPQAKEKNLELILDFDPALPASLQSDKQRLEQVLKNLLSNAIKFTEKGQVHLRVAPDNATLQNSKAPVVSFTVEDTGVGIPADKLGLVFEAFKQVDGSSSRKYTGTGLGLSISRELAKLLGGEIKLKSEFGKGSTFTVCLPLHYAPQAAPQEQTTPAQPVAAIPTKKPAAAKAPLPPIIRVPDDRDNIQPADKTILIIEDDIPFVKALSPFIKNSGYKVLIATRGDDGLALARQFLLTGILLDINLPVMDGWSVIDHLKQDHATRHIPVHTMSSDEARQKSLQSGALDFINKPLTEAELGNVLQRITEVGDKKNRTLLIIEENKQHANALSHYFRENAIDSVVAFSGEEGMEQLAQKEFDGVILDISINDKTAFSMLDQIKTDKRYETMPVIVYTGYGITISDENRINQYAATSIVRRANTYQNLLNEISIFLHLVQENTGQDDKTKQNRMTDPALKGKHVLIADDDQRTIYALSKALELNDVQVATAANGKLALEYLNTDPRVDAILIDIMMPEMDGYEAIRLIRQNPKYKHLPIIAVTAKIMPADRNKCIEAGASDYISKPVDIDQLLSLLKVWLY